MSTHILCINEYNHALGFEGDEYEPLYEGLFGRIRTTHKLAKMLAPILATGKNVFKGINDNVDDIEKLIEAHNEELKAQRKREAGVHIDDILSVQFDKAILNIQALVDVADLKFGNFTTDVLMCNIVNFKIFVAPIRMAQIMALGYRYYMAIVRECLQNALITIELYADTFFTLVRDGVAGEQEKFSEYFRKVRDICMSQLEAAIDGSDEIASGQLKADKRSREITASVIRQFKTIGSEYTKMNRDIGYGGYRQNIFQEGGKTIEQLVRDNSGKELQAMQERFNQLGNKPSKEGDNMVASYASAVKSNAEIRAYNICTKINMNMMKIVKMFSLRSQEGLSSLIAQMNSIENSEIEKEEKSIDEKMKEVREATRKQYENEAILKTKEERETQKKKLDAMGFNLLDEAAYMKLLESDGKMSYHKFLVEQGFTKLQALSILDEEIKVGDYSKKYDKRLGVDYWLPKKGYSGKHRTVLNRSTQKLGSDVCEKYNLSYNKTKNEYNCAEHLRIGKEFVNDNGKLIVNFGTVKGDFNCSGIGLTSLEGSPKCVYGSFICTDNKIEPTEYNFYGVLPQTIGKKLIADDDCDVELAAHYYNDDVVDDRENDEENESMTYGRHIMDSSEFVNEYLRKY